MNKGTLTIAIIAIAFLLVLGVIGYAVFSSLQPEKSSSANSKVSAQTKQTNSGNYETKSSDINSVTVDAEPKVISTKENPIFYLAFNTHSVALEFDVANVTTLRDNLGNIYTPINWDGSPAEGHHRSGALIFPPLKEGISSVKLLISEDAGISQREFEWNLK